MVTRLAGDAKSTHERQLAGVIGQEDRDNPSK